MKRIYDWVSKNPERSIVCWLLFVVAVAVFAACFMTPESLKTPESLRGFGFFIIGVGIAPIGLFLAQRRTVTLDEQSQNERLRRIGEEFSRAVELLGNQKAAARQGGIYALGSLASESKEKYATIIKIVASYIREAGKTQQENGDGADTQADGADVEARKSQQENGDGTDIKADGVDVEAALSVIKNRKTEWDEKPRNAEQSIFDLSNSKLINGDLSHTVLSRVNLSDIDATGCIFSKTSFEEANMVTATFKGCDFSEANFTNAQMKGVEFLKNPDNNEPCNFANTNLSGTELYDADLSGVKNLTEEQVKKAKGNPATLLPGQLDSSRIWR